MYQDLNDPFETALDHLPRLLVRYAIVQKMKKQKETEKAEDKRRDDMGESPLYRDKSGEIIQSLLDIGDSTTCVCDAASGMKKVIPIVKGVEAYTSFTEKTINDARASFNQKMNRLQGEDSIVKNKIGEIGNILSRFFF